MPTRAFWILLIVLYGAVASIPFGPLSSKVTYDFVHSKNSVPNCLDTVDIDTYEPRGSEYSSSSTQKVYTHENSNITLNIFTIYASRHHFTFRQPLNGCGTLSTVSHTLQELGCIAGCNAGFFDVVSGGCIGAVIEESTIVSDSLTPHVSYGTFRNGTVFSGYLTDKELHDLPIRSLVQGVGWLVRRGKSYISTSMQRESISLPFVMEAAPRVAVGITNDGYLRIVQADGYEPAFWGPGLIEFADLLVDPEYGNMVDAVNLDGGGSSTLYHKSSILNTCSDDCPIFGFRTACGSGHCLRKVSTVLCIK